MSMCVSGLRWVSPPRGLGRRSVSIYRLYSTRYIETVKIAHLPVTAEKRPEIASDPRADGLLAAANPSLYWRVPYNCCTATERQFGPARARKDVERYRKNGPDATTEALIRAIGAAGGPARSLLDIGAGIGVLHHELLSRGVEEAVHVEVSASYISEAMAESRLRGNADRVRFVHGDFVEVATGVPDADIVALDRVVCCYPDFEPLLRLSAARCRYLFALSYPRDGRLVKAGNALENVGRRLRRNPFRTFVHPTSRVEAVLEEMGLSRHAYEATFVWQIVVFTR